MADHLSIYGDCTGPLGLPMRSEHAKQLDLLLAAVPAEDRAIKHAQVQKATTEVIATVPEQFFALSNGRLLETTHHKSKKLKTYHWRHDIPHVSYLVTLAAGDFAEIKDEVD